MGNPLVSVIVPVYNVEAYLEECVASILAQTYGNLQIILIDDGSTDQSGGLCDAFAAKDGRVQVIHQENRGLSSARNAGLEMAEGKYVYFVDSDDWVEPAMVERTLLPMERDGYDQSIWGMTIVEEGKEDRYWGRWEALSLRFSTPEEKRRFLCRWFLSYRLGHTVWSRAYRRDLIERHGLRFQNEREIGAEDLDFTFRYLAHCQSLYYIPEGFYYYRQRNGSVMRSGSPELRMARELRLLQREEELLSHQALFRPFYIYGGVVLSMELTGYIHEMPIREGLSRIRALYQGMEGWAYLLERARLAAGDRRGILRACGPFLGGRVCAFYKYMLDGDLWPLWGYVQMWRWYERLRDMKARLRRR